MFDIIIIGARAAGSPTAMLLARKGYKVLLVDRASFPSDTLSTHQVQLQGSAALKRWGLLDKVLASNCPPCYQLSFIIGPYTLKGEFPPLEGVRMAIGPRRTILDKILVDAAVEAGAELRQDLLVEALTFEGGRVTGIRGRMKAPAMGGSSEVDEKATLVIGADGKHSLVARSVNAQSYRAKPVLTCAYYTYWEGIPLDGGEVYTLPRRAVGLWPTNDGLAMIYTGYPITEFQDVRRNIEVRFWESLDSQPGLVERVRNGRQAERFYGTADLPTFYRHPYGPGWALVGDACMTMDPITGQGIGNAFLNAERLAEAVDAGFSGRSSLEAALESYRHHRDKDTLPMYELTGQLAAFSPLPKEQQVVFAALAENPKAASQFLGVIAGSVSLPEFFSPRNLVNIMGITGIGRVLLGKISASMQSRAQRSTPAPRAQAK